MMKLYYEICGLYPEERDYVVKQLELIKHNICDYLDIRFTVLRSCFNVVSINQNIKEDDIALELFRILKEVKVPNIPTLYEDSYPVENRQVPHSEVHLLRECWFKDYNGKKL